MKKYVCLLVMVLLLMPITVSANIICNDGTVSPSCTDCHRGCCSRHGGCSASTSNDSTNTGNNVNDNYDNQSYAEQEEAENNDYDSQPVVEQEEFEETEDEYDVSKSNIIDDDKKENDDSSNALDTILGLGITGGIGYGIYRLVRKKKK